MSIENSLGVRRASTANCLSLGLASRNQRSPRTWLSDAGRPVRGADLSAQSRAGHCRHGFVRCPDHWLQASLRLRDCAASSQRFRMDQRNNQPDSGVGCTPDHGGIAEYLYYNLGNRTLSTVGIPGGIASGDVLTYRFKNDGQIARLGFNFKY
jgi:hypothetical protein